MVVVVVVVVVLLLLLLLLPRSYNWLDVVLSLLSRFLASLALSALALSPLLI